MARISFDDPAWRQSAAGAWSVQGGALLQGSSSLREATRYYRRITGGTFDVRFRATMLSAIGPNGWGEVKFVYSDADSMDDFRVDLISSVRVARLTAGGLQLVAPFVFGIGEVLQVHAWCDGFRFSLTINDIPLFREQTIGKRFNGFLGLGTYEATARFEDFDLEEYQPRESRDDIAGLTTAISSFESRHPYASSVFLMMRFDESIPELRAIFDAIEEELRHYGLTAIRADENRHHPELWSNIRILMNGCRYGVSVLETLPAGASQGAATASNPNVALETGYMMRSGKQVLLLKEERSRIQSDLIGHIWDPFSKDDLGTVRERVRIWCENILGLVRRGT